MGSLSPASNISTSFKENVVFLSARRAYNSRRFNYGNFFTEKLIANLEKVACSWSSVEIKIDLLSEVSFSRASIANTICVILA